jgi:flagellar biosynthesis/type III secretory pathway protein FliH
VDFNDKEKFVNSFFERLNKIGELKNNQFLMMQEYIKLGEFLGNMLSSINDNAFKDGYKNGYDKGYEDGKNFWVKDFNKN